MKLVTKEVEKRLQKYPLYSQDGKKKEAICVVKFFMCGVNYTWYVLEADLENKILFGITINTSGYTDMATQNISVSGNSESVSAELYHDYKKH